MKIGSLNGERSRVSAEQETPEKYRWAKEQAREYLGYLLEARNIPPEAVGVEKFLSSCSIPDVYGGWKPIAMSNYLDFYETPEVPRALAQAGRLLPVFCEHFCESMGRGHYSIRVVYT